MSSKTGAIVDLARRTIWNQHERRGCGTKAPTCCAAATSLETRIWRDGSGRCSTDLDAPV